MESKSVLCFPTLVLRVWGFGSSMYISPLQKSWFAAVSDETIANFLYLLQD